MKKIALLLSVLLLPGWVLAQDSSSFLVSVIGGEDTTPPTAPVIQSVVPTASSQIDIDWSASTDDVVVVGYVLLRNGLAIATTTLTSYTDTGLLPETLYTYEAYAFDGFNNISSTSNQLATTTLAVPVTPVATTTPSSISSTLVFMLLDINLRIGTTDVKIDWRTSKPARYELRWGRGDSYDTGYVINDTYRKEQATTITEIEPGTKYQYELIGYSADGEVVTLKRGEFKTKSIESTTPLNVSGFYGRANGEDVLLNWILPEDFVGRVRVIRSHLGYPLDPYDGAIVFDGVGKEVVDQGVLGRYDEVYYTAFVVLPDGSVSSGAVVKVRKNVGSISGDSEGEGVNNEIDIPELTVPESWEFDREDISIIQANDLYSFASSSQPSLDSGNSFLIRIPFRSVPNNLKSIIVTITDPTDYRRTHSFLLRINKEGDFYEATVPPVFAIGESKLVVEIYDYERMVVGRYSKRVEFLVKDSNELEVVFPDKVIEGVKPLLPYAGAAVLILAGFLVVWRLRDEDKA